MDERFSRTRLLLGGDAMERLAKARVAVFGLGGVGGYAAEALARSGVGALDLIDRDTVSLTNLNRQIYALTSTIGRLKAEVARERVLDINPGAAVRAFPVFYTAETAPQFDLAQYDYVVDAVDTMSAKLELAVRARQAGVPIISCMGAGNKLDPTALRVADINQTSMCPLARIYRKELRKRGIAHLKVVYSLEPPLEPAPAEAPPEGEAGRRATPGSTAFVPSVAGLLLASEVVRDLYQTRREAAPWPASSTEHWTSSF